MPYAELAEIPLDLTSRPQRRKTPHFNAPRPRAFAFIVRRRRSVNGTCRGHACLVCRALVDRHALLPGRRRSGALRQHDITVLTKMRRTLRAWSIAPGIS